MLSNAFDSVMRHCYIEGVNAKAPSPLWTLEELAARVALALAEGYEGQSSGRVSEVPNSRTLRYYTTLGMLDRPAQMRGRTAFYSKRHLSQIVAIKRLQAQGLPLAEVQEQLAGLSDHELSKIARVPDEAVFVPLPAADVIRATDAAVAARADPEHAHPHEHAHVHVHAQAHDDKNDKEEVSRSKGAFWRERPSSVSAHLHSQVHVEHASDHKIETESGVAALYPSAGVPLPIQGLPLRDGITLLLELSRPLQAIDLEAVQAAASPLLKLLETRGLVRPQPKEKEKP
jgi:DNA-binding transcriptional MerR regulator